LGVWVVFVFGFWGSPKTTTPKSPIPNPQNDKFYLFITNFTQ
jgi:hypothetical protein